MTKLFPALLWFSYMLSSSSAQHCKTYPGDSDWPDHSAWQTLNNTVSGRLTAPVAFAVACRPSTFDNATCTSVTNSWTNTSWVAQNPWMADYNDDSCRPDVNTTCTTQGYPAYVIEATNAEDVQAGVTFAKKHNVRLIVKGTGHDFPGRSSGRGSLSIWTHRIRGVDFAHNDSTAIRYGGTAAVTIGAGMRWREIYAEAAKQNLTVVGGADGSVGVGGWILNGGHSPISSHYGLGADQVLSIDIVAADGQRLTVNETSRPDLFWALRGGGGSTYAIMTSVTVRAYPQLSGVIHQYTVGTTLNSDTYWSVVAYLHTQIPTINEAGGMGYHYVIPGMALGDPSLANVSIVAGVWFFPDRTEEYVNAALQPIYSAITHAPWAVDPIFASSNNSFVPSFIDLWRQNPSERAGSDGRLGSWLLDEHGLSNFTALKAGLREAAVPANYLISHVVAGPGVRNAASKVPGGTNAVLPAWRRAYTHIVVPTSWNLGDITLKAYVTKDLRERRAPALKQLSPLSGAYINEADPSTPDWKQDYFGEHYDKLLKIKHEYDPDGVFWCKPCVGWDEWEIRDGPGIEDVLEWGIGQGSGKLCKKT